MRQKMIFFDIDGTIKGEESHKILPSTVQAIQRTRENGHICIINTGRTSVLLEKDIRDDIGFDGYVMGCGTMITYHGSTLLHETFSEALQERIIDALYRSRIDAVLEGAENDYHDLPENIHTETFRGFIMQFIGQGYGLWQDSGRSFDKFYAYTDQESQMEKFRMEFIGELDFIDREKGFYEIVPHGFSKASGIRYLANRLSVPMEDTVAVGDSNNDLSMFRCAHTKIAMGNATESLFATADYVTGHVDEDGIYQAMEWLGVLEK